MIWSFVAICYPTGARQCPCCPETGMEHHPASHAAVPALLQHGPVFGPDVSRYRPACLQYRCLQMMMETGEAASPWIPSGAGIKAREEEKQVLKIKNKNFSDGGHRNEHLFLFFVYICHTKRERERCSGADKREGAAGCAAPVGVFLSLAELLPVRPLWRRFRGRHSAGKYHQPVSTLRQCGSDDRGWRNIFNRVELRFL